MVKETIARLFKAMEKAEFPIFEHRRLHYHQLPCPIQMPGGKKEDSEKRVPRAKAGEFDYSGSQAIKALKEEGIYTIMVNPNIATIATSRGLADKNEAQLRALCSKAFATSPQVLVEKSMKGWKVIEYEVIRGCRDSCITVCNMENIDPLGIHTGGSVVVAPLQKLSDSDYNMLRTTAINVIRHLGVVGEYLSLGLKKFMRVSRLLSSSMKSVGEVMSTGGTFEETIQKAIRAIDDSFSGFAKNDYVENIDEELVNPTDKRIFAISTAFHHGYSVEKVWQMTNIDKWFLRKLYNIFEMENCLDACNVSTIPADMLRQANKSILLPPSPLPSLNTSTPHINAAEHNIMFEDRGVMVLGSGVYRIGTSHCYGQLQSETASTDYDEADRLYLENISLGTILDIYDTEQSRGVILSMGGQTPNNIALPLYRQNVEIYGSSPEMINTAENRYKFSRLLDEIGVDQPLWKELTSFEDASTFCEKVGYPVLLLRSLTIILLSFPIVISKYIEQAKEIEMDAVAKDGKMVMHYISEHVENAGVRQIEDATAKIGNALNVTGPFNIQFIAKNNEIKVIECDLRAARSFPFVSKVTGIDAIEMATKVMLGLPVEPYPDAGLPADYVGVKVPQFSFSRLSGADPVLGVEMASTGEVACFGHDKYEAYLKALISTGIVPPKKNILFSVGSYREKLEILPSVQKLHAAGYNIFATAGTADFLTEHNVPCKYLETLGDDSKDKQKSEYSLTQHLANNLIDMYINLPSKNHYRRPASYTSKGYHTRRMAVDFAIPLITNVKNAKMLTEALVRKLPLDVSTIDSKSSHDMHVFPGLINVAAFAPRLISQNSNDIVAATEASVSAGFTTVLVLPFGGDGQIARANIGGAAHCNYALSITATSQNVKSLDEELQVEAKAFSWPALKPIVTDAKGSELASILLLASLHNRTVHVTDVRSQDDLLLISLSKAKQLKVTCDVSVYSLFFTKEKYPGTTSLLSAAERKALWTKLDVIDAFSVGVSSFQVVKELFQPASAWCGVEETLPLLLAATLVTFISPFVPPPHFL
ncbi:hypothetical protein BDQ17DRAFT_1408739 [Cyathus striatus]|nr:hypothetical protein BDQ17DRAFT_1408739 [Cyathus striatus]